MSLRQYIKKILKEEFELPTYIKRRYSPEDLDNLLNNVRFSIASGYEEDDAIYNEIRYFLSTNKYDDMNLEGNEQEYWDSYIRYEKPLVNYIKDKLKQQSNKGLNETLESKWNLGNKYGNKYDYQHGYCHYFAYDIIGRLKKLYPKKNIKYYLLLAQEVDKEDGTIIQDYLIHAYIKIDNMLLDSNGITTKSDAWERLEEWERKTSHLVPEQYKTEIFEEETDKIPDYFFNNKFCNTGIIKRDIERFLSHPEVRELLKLFK